MTPDIAVIGGGPAGLAAAEIALAGGASVALFEAKPSLGRKFLMAGKSGLNLTKDEPPAAFRANLPPQMHPFIDAFGAAETRAWAEAKGEPLFTGSTGRVFPKAMKASPLLRKWLGGLGDIALQTGWRWTGWEGDALAFTTSSGPERVTPKATILALGGSSWARLGADGAWASILAQKGVDLTPFRPANMGFDVAWSPHVTERFAGHALKGVALSFADHHARGDVTVTQNGIESGPVYSLSAPIRDALEVGPVTLSLDLMPDLALAEIATRLARPRGKRSMATHLKKSLRLTGIKASVLREFGHQSFDDPERLAATIKALAVPIQRPRPIDEAISTAGGVAWTALQPDLMLTACPGVFCAGEMLDWEAPTGGYLITGCLATGRAAADAALRFIAT